MKVKQYTRFVPVDTRDQVILRNKRVTVWGLIVPVDILQPVFNFLTQLLHLSMCPRIWKVNLFFFRDRFNKW